MRAPNVTATLLALPEFVTRRLARCRFTGRPWGASSRRSRDRGSDSGDSLGECSILGQASVKAVDEAPHTRTHIGDNLEFNTAVWTSCFLVNLDSDEEEGSAWPAAIDPADKLEVDFECVSYLPPLDDPELPPESLHGLIRFIGMEVSRTDSGSGPASRWRSTLTTRPAAKSSKPSAGCSRRRAGSNGRRTRRQRRLDGLGEVPDERQRARRGHRTSKMRRMPCPC